MEVSAQMRSATPKKRRTDADKEMERLKAQKLRDSKRAEQRAEQAEKVRLAEIRRAADEYHREFESRKVRLGQAWSDSQIASHAGLS